MTFSFTKREKLKSKKLFERLMKEGASVKSYPFKLIYIALDQPTKSAIQVAVTVPKRNFKSAVQRNRIKRQMRECYRLNKHLLFNNMKGNFAFLFLYLGKEMPSYVQVNEGMLNLIKRINKKVSDAKVDE